MCNLPVIPPVDFGIHTEDFLIGEEGDPCFREMRSLGHCLTLLIFTASDSICWRALEDVFASDLDCTKTPILFRSWQLQVGLNFRGQPPLSLLSQKGPSEPKHLKRAALSTLRPMSCPTTTCKSNSEAFCWGGWLLFWEHPHRPPQIVIDDNVIGSWHENAEHCSSPWATNVAYLHDSHAGFCHSESLNSRCVGCFHTLSSSLNCEHVSFSGVARNGFFDIGVFKLMSWAHFMCSVRASHSSQMMPKRSSAFFTDLSAQAKHMLSNQNFTYQQWYATKR